MRNVSPGKTPFLVIIARTAELWRRLSLGSLALDEFPELLRNNVSNEQHPNNTNQSTDKHGDASLMKAEIRLLSNRSSYLVEFSPEITVRELLSYLLNEIHLSKMDPDGQLTAWRLQTKNQLLSADQVLARLVDPSETLILYLAPEMHAG